MQYSIFYLQPLKISHHLMFTTGQRIFYILAILCLISHKHAFLVILTKKWKTKDTEL